MHTTAETPAQPANAVRKPLANGQHRRTETTFGTGVKRVTRLQRDRDGELAIEEHVKGWPGSGFNSQTTKITARRVYRSDVGAEQVQINVEVRAWKGVKDRCHVTYGSIALNPTDAAELIAALTEVQS